MYKVLSEGCVIGFYDTLNFIKIHDGKKVPCVERVADGVLVNGKIYALIGSTLKAPKVSIEQIDGGSILFDIYNQQQNADMDTDKLIQRIDALEAVICALDKACGGVGPAIAQIWKKRLLEKQDSWNNIPKESQIAVLETLRLARDTGEISKEEFTAILES